MGIERRPKRRKGHVHEWTGWLLAGHGKAMSKYCSKCHRTIWKSVQPSEASKAEPYWGYVQSATRDNTSVPAKP